MMNQCNNCKKQYIKGKNSIGIYCSNKCQMLYQSSEYIKRWKQGLETGYVGKTLRISSYIKNYLYKKYGTGCSKCGWDKKHPTDNKPLTEIDHIDGNAENCKENNLRILCPNCHSMTLTFRNRNKNSKRKRPASSSGKTVAL